MLCPQSLSEAPAAVSDGVVCRPGEHQSAKCNENILVGGAFLHCLDKVNVRLLSALTAGVVRVAHMMMSWTMCKMQGPFKVPASVLTTFVGEVTLQQPQEIHNNLLEVIKALRGDVRVTDTCARAPTHTHTLYTYGQTLMRDTRAPRPHRCRRPDPRAYLGPGRAGGKEGRRD